MRGFVAGELGIWVLVSTVRERTTEREFLVKIKWKEMTKILKCSDNLFSIENFLSSSRDNTGKIEVQSLIYESKKEIKKLRWLPQ